MSTTTEPAITDPAWCDTEHCSEDRTGGYLRDVTRWTPEQRFTLSRGHSAVVALSRRDNHDGEESAPTGQSGCFLAIDGEDVVSIEVLESLGRWLIERAAQYRQAIATEGGA